LSFMANNSKNVDLASGGKLIVIMPAQFAK
jgi:hypothetical protein